MSLPGFLSLKGDQSQLRPWCIHSSFLRAKDNEHELMSVTAQAMSYMQIPIGCGNLFIFQIGASL